MAASFPTYPSTTFEQAVELAIFSSNQLHNIINADAASVIETEDGNIPSVRYALIDNLYFKTPAIDWEEGLSVTVFNQLYTFSGGTTGTALWYAPTATVSNPIITGTSPEDDDNWRLYGWDTYSKKELNSTSGASYIGTSDGVTVQDKISASIQFLGNYEDSTLTITSLNNVIEYDNIRYYVKPSMNLPYTTTGTTATTWESDKDSFIALGDTILRNNLSTTGGSALIAQGGSTVDYELQRFGSFKSLDVTPDSYGYSSDFIARYNESVIARGSDDVLLYGGSLNIGHRTYGTAWNSSALSIRSGVELGSQYNPQLGGTHITTQTMVDGEGIGGVSAYIDAVSLPYQDGEILSNPVYTASGLTADEVSVGVANGLIKVGAVLKTNHSIPFQGIISAIDGNTLTVRDGWCYKGGTAPGTPASGSSCYVNYQRSIWATNINTILYSNGRASAGYCAEYGMQNLSGNMNGVIGISLLHMSQSTSNSQYGMHISKSQTGQSSFWDTGCFVGGSRINYYSHGDANTDYGLYFDGSYNTAILMLGIGDSKATLAIRNESGAYPTIIAGSGQVQRMAETSVNLGSSASGTITPDYQEYHSDYGATQTITVKNTTTYSMYQHFRMWNGNGTVVLVPASGYFRYGKYSDVTSLTIKGPVKVEFRIGWSSTIIPLIVEAGTVATVVSASSGTITPTSATT